MINAQGKIKNWKEGASADLDSASVYIGNERQLHGLFLCHLAIEKSLKALIVDITNESAPKSHDIITLSKKANINFSEKELAFIEILVKYKLHGRYPSGGSQIPTQTLSETLCKQTKDLIARINKAR